MDTARLFERYRELQSYVGWTEADVDQVAAIGELLDPALPALIDDFYETIDRHPGARKVITGGQAQIDRLKGTLIDWVRELLAGRYDEAYVARRWRVGWRHVEIGLDQVYTNVALSRLRSGLTRVLQERWQGDKSVLRDTVRSLNRLLDLDLAIIEDAYQAEYVARLQRTERLATLGQVAGGVAHELRNPLNVVKTSVFYLLNARSATPEKKAEHLERIERHVELADGVINALASFAKRPMPVVNPINTQEVIRESLEVNPPPAGIDVRVDVPESLPPIMADRDQIRVVFGNLIRNACDAMPAGGQLEITGRAVPGGVEVTVADSGTGIDPENLSKIMEPLFSTKARGLGLGLSIARSIVEKNQGTLRVRSQLGEGSAFTVRLGSPEAAGAPNHEP